MPSVKQKLASLFARTRGQGEARKPLPRSLLACVGVVAGWLLVNLLAYGALLMPAGESENLVVERSANPTRANSAQGIPATPFFGRAPVEAKAPPAVDLTNIPITQLQLVLSGVFSNSTPERASALIAERGKPAQRLYVGDTLPGGAQIYSVAVDHVVLSRGGRMEKLTYPDEDGRPTVPLQQFAPQLTDISPETVEAAVSAVAGDGADREERQQSIRERLEELREMARSRQGERRPE